METGDHVVFGCKLQDDVRPKKFFGSGDSKELRVWRDWGELKEKGWVQKVKVEGTGEGEEAEYRMVDRVEEFFARVKLYREEPRTGQREEDDWRKTPDIDL